MPYPALVKDIAQRAAPGLMADRNRRYERQVRENSGVIQIARDLIGNGRMTVQAGPFAGMNYPNGRVADVDAPVAKLLGTYEQEIHSVVSDAVAGGLRTFIDVGCADGYYAVGIPCASHEVVSHAFDLSRHARNLCWEVACANVLEGQVRIGKRFTAAQLDAIDADGALLLCDIEGDEANLFDGGLVRRLARTTVVIEVHEDFAPGTSERVQTVFAGSHRTRVIRQEPREPVGELPQVAFEEFRPPELHWLVCDPA